ncbi:lipoprotein, partial [Catenovulum agarivorans DS-2]
VFGFFYSLVICISGFVMYSKIVISLFLLFSLIGCSNRVIHLVDDNGKEVGECTAGYYLHFYGLEDSIDYMLYQCAKGFIDKGYKVSGVLPLDRDYTLPKPPEGESWNKKLAMSHFKNGKITERKLGYVLAAIEYEYYLKIVDAEKRFAKGNIDETAFNKITQEAEFVWRGE